MMPSIRIWELVVGPLVLALAFFLIAPPLEARFNSMFFGREWARWAWAAWLVAGLVLAVITLREPRPMSNDAEEPAAVTELQASPQTKNKQEQIVEANQIQGYGDPEWIPAFDHIGPPDGAPPLYALQRKQNPSSQTGLISEDIVITKPNGDSFEFRYLVLFNEKSWKPGRYDLFDGESPQGIGPDKILTKAEIGVRLQSGTRIICVGLASTEFKPEQSHSNTILSDNRAIYLCNALHRQKNVHGGPLGIPTIAMGLGEYAPAVSDNTPANLQRAAIIVSIKSMKDESDIEIFDALKHSVASKGVRLSNYRRDDDNEVRMFNVRGEEFAPSDSDHWINTDGSFFVRDSIK